MKNNKYSKYSKIEKELYKFIKGILHDAGGDGCYIFWLDKYYKDKRLAFVFAYDTNNSAKPELNGKIAYNCDDLQCDYSYDWESPDIGDLLEIYDIGTGNLRNQMTELMYILDAMDTYINPV